MFKSLQNLEAPIRVRRFP